MRKHIYEFTVDLIDLMFFGMKVHTERILTIFFTAFVFGALLGWKIDDGSASSIVVDGLMCIVAVWEILIIVFVLSERE